LQTDQKQNLNLLRCSHWQRSIGQGESSRTTLGGKFAVMTGGRKILT